MTTKISKTNVEALIKRFEEVAEAIPLSINSLSRDVFGGTYNFNRIKKSKNLYTKTYDMAIDKLEQIMRERLAKTTPLEASDE